MSERGGESRHGVSLTNLDQPLFDGADATKRDLVDYLDAINELMIPVLRDRPLSVIRVHRGQEAFMQKNVPKYTPDWVPTVTAWAESSKREVTYALCNDRRTLLWFANQRAVEFHPALTTVDDPDHATHLVLDIDPPHDDAKAFGLAARAAHVMHDVLDAAGLQGAVKTSGAKGVHVFVPLDGTSSLHDQAAATRALAARAEERDGSLVTTAFMKEDRDGKVFMDSTRAGGATVVAAYSPRVRDGVPISFPIDWPELDHVVPSDFTLHTAVQQLEGRPSWTERMPAAQALPSDLVEHGHEIPIARVQAMHEGKRRRRASKESGGDRPR
jgi:bifunctional non-homologous end joining protein LigD